MRRRLAALLVLLALAPAAFAYYHFVRYPNRGNYVPVYDRFDLSVLPDKTVSFLVSDVISAQLSLAPGDSYASVVSQIRSAGRVWNSVSTAEIKLQFGGVFTPGAAPGVTMSSPAIEVVFDDLPPGVLGYGGPVVRGDTIFAGDSAFTPIVTSRVILPRNLASRPSWSESFYLSAVHEFGHALGLQHTYTSSVMSTEVTRGTTKARPLGADDIAGLSILYPTRKFASTTGVIQGRVTAAGSPVALASVVAVSSSGDAVSSLTAPDGTYRIEGVAPGAYYVYAHPLPPFPASDCSYGANVNVCLPLEAGAPVQPTGAFDVVFFPNTRTPQQTLFVTAGQATSNIDFAVVRRASVTMHSLQTYSFFTRVAVKPGYLLQTSATGSVIMTGNGMISNRAPVAGLTASVIGGAEYIGPNGLRAYSPSPDYYLQMDVQTSAFAGEGPRHLLLQTPSESYVLPAAFTMVRQAPPTISEAVVNPDRTVSLSGTSLSAKTRVWFDGVQVEAKLAADGKLLVAPPPAGSQHQSVITVFNPDGQSSLFTLGNQSPLFTYDAAPTPSFTLSPSSVPSGVETVVEVKGDGTLFAAAADPKLGFGTSDVRTRQLWVTGTDRMLANIRVAPSALQTVQTATTVSGLQLTTMPWAFWVTGAQPRQMYVPYSSMTGFYAYPGAVVSIPVSGVEIISAPATSATLDGQPLVVTGASGNQVQVQIPDTMPLGPAVLRLTIGGDAVLPIALPIDARPPVILTLVNSSLTPLDATRPPAAGETLGAVVTGLAEPGTVIDPSRIKVLAGGLEHTVHSVSAYEPQPSSHLVQFTLSPQTLKANVSSILISIDNRVSLPFALVLRDDMPATAIPEPEPEP